MTLLEYKWVILFYLIIVFLIVRYRKKFDFQAKIIALLRTKIGLKFLDKEGKRHGPFWKLFGYIGVGVGFIGMGAITYLMIDALWKLITVPNSAPGVSLILPGVRIPGSPIFVPFWYGIIALFVVVVVHETAHGLVARAYKIPVKNTGIVFFGPLIGAFVEPNDKVLNKRPAIEKYSVFAAGPFSNIVLALVIALVMNMLIVPAQGSLSENNGFYFEDVQEGYPAMEAGITPGTVYNQVNGVEVTTAQELLTILQYTRPNESLVLAGKSGSFEITTTTHPEDESRGYIGIIGLVTNTKLKNENGINKFLADLLMIIATFFKWIVVLSLGIGLANLLPLGPVDGGRMLLLALESFYKDKKAKAIWTKVSAMVLLILALNLLWPAFRWIGGLF